MSLHLQLNNPVFLNLLPHSHPTVVGLCQEGGYSSSIPQEMCDLIAQTVARSIDMALTQRSILAPSSAPVPMNQSSRASSHLTTEAPVTAHSPSHFHHSDQSFLNKEEAFDYSLSGDEEDPSSVSSPSTDLFRHELFKTLLHKAKITANLGISPMPTSLTSDLCDSNTRLFTEKVTEQETVPSPKLFLDTVQHQWTQPSSISNPSGLDKKLYTVEQEF